MKLEDSDDEFLSVYYILRLETIRIESMLLDQVEHFCSGCLFSFIVEFAQREQQFWNVVLFSDKIKPEQNLNVQNYHNRMAIYFFLCNTMMRRLSTGDL